MERVEGHGRFAAAAQPFAGTIAGNAGQPGAESFRLRTALERAVSPQEGILRDIFCSMGVPRQDHGQAEHTAMVPPHQDIERCPPAAQTSTHEDRVALSLLWPRR